LDAAILHAVQGVLLVYVLGILAAIVVVPLTLLARRRRRPAA
jgi:hypothetical protein